VHDTDDEAPIGVVGGGLAGLTVALRLARAGRRVALFEAEPRLGGQLHTEHSDGFLIEHGAEGFVARSEALQELAEELGIGAELVGQAQERSFGYDAGQLRVLAPGEAAAFLGFQVPNAELGKGIRSFARGMGSLSDALAAACSASGVVIHLASPIERLNLVDGQISLERAAGAQVRTSQVLLATSAARAASLLEPLLGAEAAALRQSATLSSVTVSLAYPRAAVGHALDGTGFVVRHPEAHEGLRACTFTSSKFERRAPEGHVSLRAFFRPEPAELAGLDEAAWRDRATRQLGAILQLGGPAMRGWVSRWPSALPVHDRAHAERVAALEAQLAALPIRLVGAAFHGSGIDAAVRSALRVAGQLSHTAAPAT
jgi:oxygen-dependent protoporphyrinogen oxidase